MTETPSSREIGVSREGYVATVEMRRHCTIAAKCRNAAFGAASALDIQSRSCGIIRRSALWFGVFDELDELLAELFTAAEEWFLATRSRILARRNPQQLIEGAVWLARVDRVLDAMGGRYGGRRVAERGPVARPGFLIYVAIILRGVSRSRRKS
jgi:hypothetical protein